jgi:hypothetical protein
MAPDNRNQQDPSRQEDTKQNQQEQNSNFDNPQDGRKWDNYQTRTLSSDTGETENNMEENRPGSSPGKENSGESV